MADRPVPIGFALFQAARATARAFESHLFGREGASLSTWLVLLALNDRSPQLQSDLVAFVGVQGPTLTHHLNGMERERLIQRSRDANDRRVHHVVITEAGRRRFQKLKTRAESFDAALRRSLTKDEMAHLRELLSRLTQGAVATEPQKSERRKTRSRQT